MHKRARAIRGFQYFSLLLFIAVAGCGSGSEMRGALIMNLGSTELLDTSALGQSDLNKIPDFLNEMQDVAANADVSGVGIGGITIEMDSYGRWMVATFTVNYREYIVSGSLFSPDLIVPSASSIQFKPRLFLGRGIAGPRTAYSDQAARPLWEKLKAALAIISSKAASDVGIQVPGLNS